MRGNYFSSTLIIIWRSIANYKIGFPVILIAIFSQGCFLNSYLHLINETGRPLLVGNSNTEKYILVKNKQQVQLFNPYRIIILDYSRDEVWEYDDFHLIHRGDKYVSFPLFANFQASIGSDGRLTPLNVKGLWRKVGYMGDKSKYYTLPSVIAPLSQWE